MSTKSTIKHGAGNSDLPAWHLYEDVFENGVVYLELEGVAVDVCTIDTRSTRVVLRLPTETAKELGLLARPVSDGVEK